MEKVARPYRVCLTGAESTGKSRLALELGRALSAPVVPEFAREYAERAARELTYLDVGPIARGQMEMEDRLTLSASALLIFDTDLVSTVVYSRHHYGSCPEWVAEAAKARSADLYLLLDIDVPWIADAVRDSGDTRAELHERFRDALEEIGAAYEVIRGTWKSRFEGAVGAIRERMKDEG